MTLPTVRSTDPCPQILRHAVLRVATTSIETVDAFADGLLAASCDELLALVDTVQAARQEITAALGEIVGHTTDRRARADLLGARRALHRADKPLADLGVPLTHLAAVDERTAAVLKDDDAARRTLVNRYEEFSRVYDDVLSAQKEQLRDATAAPRLSTALALSNPGLSLRWTRSSITSRRARDERLQNAVYRYLARSAGRATPADGWAGTVAVEPTDEVDTFDIAPARPAWRVAPDLRCFTPFFALLNRSVDQMTPLLPGWSLRCGDRGWDLRSTADGTEPLSSGHLRILDLYRDSAAHTKAEVIELLGADRDENTKWMPQIVDDLIARRLLVPAYGPPDLADDPWATLESVASTSHHCAQAFARMIRGLRGDALALVSALDAEDGGAVRRALAAARDHVSVLWDTANLEGEPPGRVFVVDLRAPWTVRWGVAARNSASAAASDVLAFTSGCGTAETFRRLRTASAIGGSLRERSAAIEARRPTAPPDTLAGAFEAVAGDHGRRAAELLRPAIHGELDALAKGLPLARQVDSAGPVGSMLFTLADTGENAHWFGRGRPQLAFFTHRFAELIESPGTIDELRAIIADWLNHGVHAVDVRGYPTPNPNAATGPRWCAELLDVRSPAGGLDRLVIRRNADATRWTLSTVDGRSLFPVFASGATIGTVDGPHGDPAAGYGAVANEKLALTAFGLGWELLAGGGLLRYDGDFADDRRRDRIVLPSGAVLSRQQWVVTGAALDRLKDARSESERYLQWRRICRDDGFPALVWVRVGAHPDLPELPVPSSSPLGVRAVLAQLDEATTQLTALEPPGPPDGWPLVDEVGGHYLAELGITWHDPGYWAAGANDERRVG